MTLSPSRPLLAVAAISGFTAVLLGAMGAHGPVHDMLVASGKLESWETGVRYHLPHSMFLYVLALFLGGAGRCAKVGWVLVCGGMMLFSSSIYLLASQGWKWLGPVTPLGGLLLMVGWLVLAFASWKKAA
jgi:uncharacterized membrane protein YgdD (TMEM256/DUF423 family)